MFDLPTTRGSWNWGWGAIMQPVLEYILLALAVIVFVVVWFKWFYGAHREGYVDAEAQDAHSVLAEPTQQQAATYGSVSTARRTVQAPKPLAVKPKQRTVAHHAHTVPTRAPTRSGTSVLNNVFGRAPPSKVGTIPQYAPQHDRSHHDGLHESNRILLTEETHDEPQSLYPNGPPTPIQTNYLPGPSSRSRGHTSSMHTDHVQTLRPPQPAPIRTTTMPTYTAHPQIDSPIEDDSAYAHIDREWEHLHGLGALAPSIRSSSGSEGDDDLIDATLQEGPAKRYREKAREEARYRRAAFEASKKAYRANRKAEAKQLSDQGKLHDENVRRYNSMAAAEIFRLNNPRYTTTQRYSRCDLHGLHIEEARQYAESHIRMCYQAGVEKTMLIVGKGSHSQRGSARIKPAILEMLRGRSGISAGTHEKNEGCIVIEFAHHQGTR